MSKINDDGQLNFAAGRFKITGMLQERLRHRGPFAEAEACDRRTAPKSAAPLPTGNMISGHVNAGPPFDIR